MFFDYRHPLWVEDNVQCDEEGCDRPGLIPATFSIAIVCHKHALIRDPEGYAEWMGKDLLTLDGEEIVWYQHDWYGWCVMPYDDAPPTPCHEFDPKAAESARREWLERAADAAMGSPPY